MRRIICKNVNNMRDLGGYRTINNKETKFNVFIRSNVPQEMNDIEIKYLLDNNINTVIDLRNDTEISRKSNILNNDKFNYYNVSLIGDKCPETEEDIPSGYINILDNKETIYKVFTILSSSEGGVLFNCTAGKDRTGVIAMLLLMLAKVPEDDIIADYSISYIYLREEIRKMHNDNPDLPAFLGQSKYKYMEQTIELFKNKYKNVENYFDYIGILKDDKEEIRNKFVF